MPLLAIFSATRLGWLPLLLVWTVGPFLVAAFLDSPPTIISNAATIHLIGWLGALLYSAFGTWMLSRDYHGLAIKEGRRFDVAISIWALGIAASVLLGAMNEPIAEWINSTSRHSTMQRSLLLQYYSTERKGARNTRYTVTSYAVPDRGDPEKAAFITGLAGLRLGNSIAHLCMTEHVGRLGWYWYENVHDCDTPPEHLALAWLEGQRVQAQAFVDQGGALDAGLTDIPLFQTYSYSAIAPGASPEALVKVIESGPTPADDARVGADLLALGRQLPLPYMAKHSATVKAWSDRYILVQLESKLFLQDRARNAWIYLKTVDRSPVGLYDRSVWLFGRDGHSLYQYQRESFGPGIFTRWSLTDSRPMTGRDEAQRQISALVQP